MLNKKSSFKRFISYSAVFFTILISAQSSANAATGCVSEEALDELLNASINYNTQYINKLLASGMCKQVNQDYTIVKRGLLRSKVTLSDGTVLWISN